MQEENLILKNWLLQKKLFLDNLYISHKRPTKDSVHDLRVAVKRMRSYLRLNEEFTNEHWKPGFDEIRELFKSFGRLRDFDMSLELCRKYERKWQLSLSAFKQYLNTNRSLTRRWAKWAAINFNEQQPVFNFQFGFFNELTIAETSEKIIALANGKIKKTKRLKKHFQKNAHEIRKQLKDALYWVKICPKDMAESFVDVKHLDSLLKYLGNWQDQFIFKKKLRQYSKEFATKIEKQALNELEKNIASDQKQLLKRAANKLASIENKRPNISTPLVENNVTNITQGE